MLWLVISACHLIYDVWCFWCLQLPMQTLLALTLLPRCIRLPSGHTHTASVRYCFFCIYIHQLSSYLVLVNCFTFYGASISWSCVSCSSGKVVSGYRVRNGQWTQIGRQSPLLPQVCVNVSTLPDQAWLIHGIYRGNLMHHLSLIRVVSHVNDPSSVFYVLPAVRPVSTLSLLFTKVSVSAISSKHNIQCIHVECTHIRSMHY